jgi:hypothetical protein
MQFEFDEKIDSSIQKSLKSTVRLFKERLRQAEEGGTSPSAPSYEEFESALKTIMDSNKAADLNKLRTPSLRELFDRAWSQKLRSYSIQKQLRDAYEALVRRY